jgi:hypothetical protein
MACFLPVAGNTAGDDVIPSVFAATEAGHYVINSERAFFSTILADIAVTVKNTDSCQFAFGSWTADNIIELYYGRYGKRGICRPDIAHAVFKHLRLSRYDQSEGALDMANVEWLIALI